MWCKNVTVNPDLRTRLRIALDPSDVQLEEIVVTQAKPPIQTDVTSTTYMISGEDLRVLPSTGPPTSSGTRPESRWRGTFAEARAPKWVLPGGWASGAGRHAGRADDHVPISTVVGMSVSTGGFEPEYGNALSGIVNIVTRTGGNDHQFTARADRDNLFGGTPGSARRPPVRRVHQRPDRSGTGSSTSACWAMRHRHAVVAGFRRQIFEHHRQDHERFRQGRLQCSPRRSGWALQTSVFGPRLERLRFQLAIRPQRAPRRTTATDRVAVILVAFHYGRASFIPPA